MKRMFCPDWMTSRRSGTRRSRIACSRRTSPILNSAGSPRCGPVRHPGSARNGSTTASQPDVLPRSDNQPASARGSGMLLMSGSAQRRLVPVVGLFAAPSVTASSKASRHPKHLSGTAFDIGMADGRPSHGAGTPTEKNAFQLVALGVPRLSRVRALVPAAERPPPEPRGARLGPSGCDP